MTTWLAFFRGINVGGNNMLPMKALVALLENAGFKDVITYLQSGNVVFRSLTSQASQLTQRVGYSIPEQFGFEPRILILSSKLAQQAERLLGVDATARNWNTVCKVLEIARRFD